MADRSPAVLAAAVLLAATFLASDPARAQLTAPPGTSSQTELRVCADPHNLPFSNDKKEGFENRIAELVGHDLNLPVTYTWFPDSQGFVRATLMKHRCDVVMGTVAGADDMATTDSYYHTGYVMVTRQADNITTDKVGDWKIAGRRFAIVAQTPPTDLIVEHSLMDQTKIYSLVVDTRIEQPAITLVNDVAAGVVDVGLIWGPIAGWAAAHAKMPLRLTFLDPQGSKVRLDYHIAMGVRQGDVDFRRKLNGVIQKDQKQILQILQEYHVPLLDEQNRPLQPAASP